MKVGIIGCGGISKFHVVGFEQAGCELAWFCDIHEPNAQKWAEQYKDSKVTKDYKEVLADPEVKMVCITTLTNLHFEMVTNALKAGKAVICEKTLGMDSKEALEICKVAKETNGWLVTAYMKRYFPAIQKAKEILENTKADIVSVYALTFQPFPGLFLGPFDYVKDTDNFLNTFMGGGAVVCGGSHIVDLLHYFCGLPTACCGAMSFSTPEVSFDRCSNAMFWFENGAVAHFEANWHEHRKIGFEKNGWDESITINTNKGQIIIQTPLWHEPEKNAARISYIDALTGEYTEYRFDNVNPFHLHTIDEVKRFENGEPPAVTGWDGYVADVMIDAIKESHEKDSKVKIKWDKDFQN